VRPPGSSDRWRRRRGWTVPEQDPWNASWPQPDPAPADHLWGAERPRAIVAVAHSILVIAWHLLPRNQPYTDLGGDYFLERQNSEAYRKRLVRQLERMGHKVTLEPAQVA
jgi:hypothetical protein